MTGVPSPGHHAGSSAPTHTRLPSGQQPNGHAVNGQMPGQFRKTPKGSAKEMRRTGSARSSEVRMVNVSVFVCECMGVWMDVWVCGRVRMCMYECM